MPIQSTDDCNKLQYNIDQLDKWCTNNSLNLNTNECFHKTFKRNKYNFNSLYQINNKKHNTKYKVIDLNIIFSCDISFTEHINEISNKASRIFGFLNYNC